jgi:hydroxyethylthiazole kinase-like uncharacterized protein yjeF
MPARPSTSEITPGLSERLPLHDVAASRVAEQRAAAALPPHTLMQRAGTALARLALALAPHARHVWIATGPGNNGGDGWLAAAWLRQAGRRVSVAELGDAAKLPDDARWARAQALAAGVPVTHSAQPPADADLLVDALLGLGSRRAPQGVLAAAIEALHTHGAPVLAVDLPSGLHADTGQPLGEAVVRADHTLALLTLKPGLFTGRGRDLCGRVWFDALDVPADTAPATAWRGGGAAARALSGARRHAQHKGSFGDVIVVGGAAGMTGAAWLCAEAALAAGAGRVHVDLLAGAQAHAGWPELMLRPGMSEDETALSSATVACGCGGGDAVLQCLPRVMAAAPRLVLDADALNTLAAHEQLRDALAQRAARGQHTLLTPHPLEAARLLGSSAAEVQHDRVAAAQALAERLECAVLLKGSGTVIAAPGRPPVINATGNALLASAGTGDVLAGWAAGLWSAGGSGSGIAARADAGGACASDMDNAEAQAVGAAAAWLHGHAADRAAAAGRQAPLLASQLIAALPATLTPPADQGAGRA